MTDQLPPGWSRAPLADVGTWGSGGTPSRSDAKAYGGDIPWLKIGDLPDGPVVSAEERITEHGLAVSAAKLLPPNTLLVAMYGSIGKLGITTEACATNQAIAFCKPHAGFNLNYLFYLLMGERYRLLEQGQGGTQLNISQTILKAHEVSIAPSAEQKRIVSKIDELFSRIDEGERALQRVSMLVERYRQSVLKAAVTGELTRAWREKNKDKLESSEALLARILKARREAWEKAELAKMKAKGITPANNKWKQKYEEPVPPDTSDLPELPPGWVYVNIDVLVEPIAGSIRRGPFGSTLTKSIFVSSGYKVYEQQHAIGGDFTAGRYYIDEKKYQELSSFWLRPGDLIVSCSGTVGRVATVPEDAQPGVMNQALLKLTLARTVMSRDFFKLAFAHRLASFSSRGSGMNNFSGIDELKKMPFPLAPLEEQGEVLQQAERQFSVTDHQTAELERQQKVVNSLRQAVLREGFRGALVSQDPTDEPASVLLRRIAAERGTDNAAPKRGRKKKTAA